MAQSNKKATIQKVHTHGGVEAYPHLKPLDSLRRSVLSCLLWEDNFYEDGVSIAERIQDLAQKVTDKELASLAIEARSTHHLRHVPLVLLCALAKRGGKIVGDTIAETIQRADELSELIALYWKDGKRPLSAQMKLGLARAMHKFDAYQFAKYNRDKAIKLRDVMFMVHPRPNKEKEALFKQIAEDTLPVADTWEVSLSAGKDKRETFERLLREDKLGYLAVLRNLRKMMSEGVPEELVMQAILERRGAHNVLPFRYVAAARACPQLEGSLNQALLGCIGEQPKLDGVTFLVVDVSGSMNAPLSAKSDLTRMHAAATLAAIWPGRARVFTFSNAMVEIAQRVGMAGVDAIIHSQHHGGTDLAGAITIANTLKPERLVVITDEQATTYKVPEPVAKHSYLINVAPYKNGIGYGKWVHVDGFSESVLKFIHAYEK